MLDPKMLQHQTHLRCMTGAPQLHHRRTTHAPHAGSSCGVGAHGVQVKQDFKEIVLSARQDEFFSRHMTSNYGDFALAASELLNEVAEQKKGKAKFKSLQVRCGSLE